MLKRQTKPMQRRLHCTPLCRGKYECILLAAATATAAATIAATDSSMIKCKQKRKCAHRTTIRMFVNKCWNNEFIWMRFTSRRSKTVRIDFDFVGFSSIVNIYGSMISCRTHSRNIAWTRVHVPTVLLNIMFLFIDGIRRRTPYSSPFVRRALSVRLVCM